MLYGRYIDFLRDYYDAATSYSYSSTVIHVLIDNFSDNSVCSRYISESEGKGGMRVKSREGGNFKVVREIRELYLPLAQIRDTR